MRKAAEQTGFEDAVLAVRREIAESAASYFSPVRALTREISQMWRLALLGERRTKVLGPDMIGRRKTGGD